MGADSRVGLRRFDREQLTGVLRELLGRSIRWSGLVNCERLPCRRVGRLRPAVAVLALCVVVAAVLAQTRFMTVDLHRKRRMWQ